MNWFASGSGECDTVFIRARSPYLATAVAEDVDLATATPPLPAMALELATASALATPPLPATALASATESALAKPPLPATALGPAELASLGSGVSIGVGKSTAKEAGRRIGISNGVGNGHRPLVEPPLEVGLPPPPLAQQATPGLTHCRGGILGAHVDGHSVGGSLGEFAAVRGRHGRGDDENNRLEKAWELNHGD